MEIEYDSWRQDLIKPNGVLIARDVLFIRGRYKNIEFNCPVLNNSEEDTKTLIQMNIESYLRREVDGDTSNC